VDPAHEKVGGQLTPWKGRKEGEGGEGRKLRTPHPSIPAYAPG